MIQTEGRWFNDEGDLIDFVLSECAGISEKGIVHDEYSWVKAYSPNNSIRLEIYEHFDMLYVFYLDQLLQKHFKKPISDFRVHNRRANSNENYDLQIENIDLIEKMDHLDTLLLPEHIQIPKLPDSLNRIYQFGRDFSKIMKEKEFSHYKGMEEDVFYLAVGLTGRRSTTIPYYDKRSLLDDITKGVLIV